jgi:hypothetical protein
LRSTLYRVGLGALAGGLVVWLALGRPGSRPPPPAEAPANGGGRAEARVIRLDSTARHRIGIELAPLEAVELANEVRGFGRLLDPVALAAPVYDRQAARAAAEAAEREYRRVQTLQRGNSNASQRDLEAARSAFERDQAALGAAEARVVSAWGAAGAARPDLAALAQSLVARKSSVARVDLPLGEDVPGNPAAARVAALADEAAGSRTATLIGSAPDADPTTQGRGFLLLVEGAPWPPGTALAGWLAAPGPPLAGVEVPAAALVRHAGRTFVFVEAGDDAFVRRAVELERRTPQGWLVARGLAAGDRVVLGGAQQLLSEELAGATSAED